MVCRVQVGWRTAWKVGQGNWHFRSATNQTPRFAQPGEPAIERTVILQLKVLADVGLVGFPNAGKSTLLSVVSAAKPEIADYPFTTLVPNLGIVPYRDNKSFVMADIPGIIEGAAEGRGLGLRFLRHIERNSILLFMVSADSADIRAEFNILLNELKQYNPELVDKQRILAVSKCDMLDEQMMEEMKSMLPEDIQTVFISSVSGLGISELKDLIWTEINKESNKIVEITHRPMQITAIDEMEDDEPDDEVFDEEDEDDDDLSKYKGIGWDDL